MDTVIFKIGGMHCDGCADRIQRLLGKEPGVRQARVSFAEEAAEVRYNRHGTSEQRLRDVIEVGGFRVLARAP